MKRLFLGFILLANQAPDPGMLNDEACRGVIKAQLEYNHIVAKSILYMDTRPMPDGHGGMNIYIVTTPDGIEQTVIVALHYGPFQKPQKDSKKESLETTKNDSIRTDFDARNTNPATWQHACTLLEPLGTAVRADGSGRDRDSL